MKPCLIGGVHAVGAEVFDLAVEKQPERAAAVGFAEIEFETVQIGKAQELSHAEITDVAGRQQIGERGSRHAQMASAVPRTV